MLFRVARVAFILVSLTGLGRADNVVTLMDQFNVAPCPIPPPAGDPQFNNCDTIGAKTDFDIEKAVINFNGTQISIDYYLNYREGAVNFGVNNPSPLDSFNVTSSVTLRPGDIFFSGPGGMMYGIALSSHDGFNLGGLYAIGGGSGVTTRTASNVLGLPSPPWYYRTDRDVWLGGVAPSTSAGNATVQAFANGNGTTTGAEYRVSLVLDSAASQALYGAALGNGGYLDAHFQSLNCGNDILDGRVSVAEPSDYSAAGTVVFLLGLGLFRRRRFCFEG